MDENEAQRQRTRCSVQLGLFGPDEHDTHRGLSAAEARERAIAARDDGALFAVSHSGGKDSQAMMLEVAALVPAEQIVVVHATLGPMEWEDTIAHIKATKPAEIPLIVAAHWQGKTLLDRVRERGQWPDRRRRWCTT